MNVNSYCFYNRNIIQPTYKEGSLNFVDKNQSPNKKAIDFCFLNRQYGMIISTVGKTATKKQLKTNSYRI